MNIIIKTQGNVTPKLLSMAKLLRNQKAQNKVMAYAGKTMIQKHAVGLANWNRNRFGAPSKFWKRMRGSVQSSYDPLAATVTLPAEWGHRYHGGTVRPGLGISSATGEKTKAIAIPLTKQAYGKRPGFFKDLFFVPAKQLGFAKRTFRSLIGKGNAIGTLCRLKGKGKRKKVEALYALRDAVKHAANSKVLPPLTLVQDAIVRALEAMHRRNLERAETGAQAT
jgi:hypothetical protein